VRRTILLTLPAMVLIVSVFFVGRSSAPTKKTAEVTTTTLVLQAPAIKESFTPLPCSKDTTIGMEGCAEHMILSLDREIDSRRRSVFVRLADTPSRRHFLRAESDWLTFRRAACLSEADVNRGGTIAPLDFAECVVRLSRQHLSELDVQLASYTSH